MHSYLKWVIYGAIFGFVSVLGIFIYMNIQNDRVFFNASKKIEIDSLVADHDCEQDSIRQGMIDTQAHYTHIVDSISKRRNK